MILIDEEAGSLTVTAQDGTANQHALSSPEAFAELSRLWLKSGWYNKHVYSFTWLGRPVIQLPEDLLRVQELIWQLRPTLIIETGIAHGGSLIFYASVLRLLGGGRVIGIDVDIRAHHRAAIEAHDLSPAIMLIEGSSTAPDVVDRVRREVGPNDRVLAILDSNHSKDHVLAELAAYAPLVSVGSYAIATDGIKELVAGGPRTEPDWSWNHPKAAAEAFVAANPAFIIEEPRLLFNEGSVSGWISHWPGGFVKRLR
jgi:cephalosporin hydroxylase